MLERRFLTGDSDALSAPRLAALQFLWHDRIRWSAWCRHSIQFLKQYLHAGLAVFGQAVKL
jgi:IS5 family transposase